MGRYCSGGLETDGIGGRGVSFYDGGEWADVHGRVEERRGRRGKTSSGEKRGNETGKVVIAHGSLEF